MLNKRERWATEGALSRIQGKGMNQIYKLLATQDFGRDVERFMYFVLFQAKFPGERLLAG